MDGSGDGVGVPDVADDRERLPAGGLDLLGRREDRAGQLRMRLGGLRHQRDLCAVAGGADSNCEADSTTPA
jgi:hypothetical protein